MIKKLVIIGIVLLLVGVAGVSAQQMNSDIAPDSPTSMNQWTTSTADLGLPLNIQQTQTVPYYHSSNMVLDTDNATVQKYCNPPPLPVLH